jgi:hypothetical protein
LLIGKFIFLNMLEDKVFQGKSILFLSPSFFGYEVAIRNKLVELGAKVFYIDDRPSNSSVTKGLIRIHKDLARNTIAKYYEDIAEQTAKDNFDVVFLLNPEALPLAFLELCKLRWPQAYYVMYMWDSIKNRKHTLDFLPYCDRVFTFERGDAEVYGFDFKPLFYLDAYGAVRGQVETYEYDLCFMGTAHSDRYGIAREVRDWCDSKGLRCFFYFYVQGLGLYWFNKLKSKGVMPSLAEVSFEKMSFADIVRVVGASRAVLDIQHPRQTGLTMRTLETLGAGRRLVTTNGEVRGYDFYDEGQVRVIDRMMPSAGLDVEFFRDDRRYIPLEKIEFCSIRCWLQEVIKV